MYSIPCDITVNVSSVYSSNQGAECFLLFVVSLLLELLSFCFLFAQKLYKKIWWTWVSPLSYGAPGNYSFCLTLLESMCLYLIKRMILKAKTTIWREDYHTTTCGTSESRIHLLDKFTTGDHLAEKLHFVSKKEKYYYSYPLKNYPYTASCFTIGNKTT